MALIKLCKPFCNDPYWEKVAEVTREKLEEVLPDWADKWRIEIRPIFERDEFGMPLCGMDWSGSSRKREILFYFHPDDKDPDIEVFIEANIIDNIYQVLEQTPHHADNVTYLPFQDGQEKDGEEE